MDIADFDLKVYIDSKRDAQEFKVKPDTKIISIAKHLCGGATDLALTSLSL